MKLSFLVFAYALAPASAAAQLFTFGVQGGVPAKAPLGQTDDKIPFVLGPTAEVRLFSGLSLSTGVLFSRTGSKVDNYFLAYPENSFTAGYSTARSHAIEVPVLARFRFLGERRNWRPFVSAGPTLRRTTIETTSLTSILSGNPLNPPAPRPVLNSLTSKTARWNADPAAGVGVDFRSGRFHLEPEVRYSHWGAGKHSVVRQNQVHFLLGFRF